MWWREQRYVSVGEKRARAERKFKALVKKNPNLRPIIIEGSTLVTTWWGKAWNKNLKSYADYSNRVGRGSSYVRHRAVLDLQINPGRVTALVMGSRSTPYEVSVDIQPLDKKIWEGIKEQCVGHFDSLKDLLAGKFPKKLAQLFTVQREGLFPSPKDITMNCSCPDWATMCKHVAATLYGIGARFDEDPALFFELRKVRVEDLVEETLNEATTQLLDRSEERGSQAQIIDDSELSTIFGIDMDDIDVTSFQEAALPAPKSKSRTKADQKKSRTKPGLTEAETGSLPKQDKILRKSIVSVISLESQDRILACVEQSIRGVSFEEIQKETGLDLAKIRYVVTVACRKGLVERISRGVYGCRDIPNANNTERVLLILRKQTEGLTLAELKEATGLTGNQLSPILHREAKKGQLVRLSRGVYGWQR